MNVRSTLGKGLSAPGETEAVIGSNLSWLGEQPAAVIFCHGADDLAIDPFRDQYALLRGIAPYATVHVGDLGGNTWANDVGVARVRAAVLHLREKWGHTGKVALIGMSMGHAVACAYAKAYPGEVACIAGVIPLVDMNHAISIMNLSPFTYRWTGDENNSTSEKVNSSGTVVAENLFRNPKPNYLPYWDASSSSGTVEFITNSQGRPAVKATVDGTANWAIYTARGGPQPLTASSVVGDTYTITYTIKASFANGFAMRMGWGSAAAQFTEADVPVLVPDVATTRVWTFTVPEGGGETRIFLKPYFTESLAPEGINTFELSDIMVIKSSTSPEYFDGDTPALPGPIDVAYSYSKKIDYGWLGTADDSNSYKTPIGNSSAAIVNYYRSPRGPGSINAATTSNQISSNAMVPNGGPILNGSFFRRTFTATAGTVAGADIFTCGNPVWSGEAGGGVLGFTAGTFATVNLSAYVRSSIAQTVRMQGQGLLGVGGAGVSEGQAVTLVPNKWTRLSVVYTASPTAKAVRLDVDGAAGAVSWQAGDTFDLANLQVTAGSTLHPYFDGAFADEYGYNEYTDGPLHNPMQMDLSSIPHKIWCATADPFTPIEVADAYVAAHPEVELVNLGGWGHTDNAVTIATPQIIEWVSEHIA